MDHHIDRMSENMIDEYVTHGRLVDINDDDRHTAILLVHFTPKGISYISQNYREINSFTL